MKNRKPLNPPLMNRFRGKNMLFIIRNNAILDNCINHLRGLRGTWKVSITQAKRTSSQNAYFHALLDIIAPHTPYPPQELKEILKAELIGVQEVAWKGKKYVLPIPSSSLDQKQYSLLLEKLIMLASELAITTPTKEHFGYR